RMDAARRSSTKGLDVGCYPIRLPGTRPGLAATAKNFGRANLCQPATPMPARSLQPPANSEDDGDARDGNLQRRLRPLLSENCSDLVRIIVTRALNQRPLR